MPLCARCPQSAVLVALCLSLLWLNLPVMAADAGKAAADAAPGDSCDAAAVDGGSGGAGGAASTPTRMPVIYMTHGGGPCFWMEDEGMMKGMGRGSPLHRTLQSLPAALPARPTAIVVFSAHWDERDVAVYSREDNDMLFDYYGFPPHTYELEWRPRGSPPLAERCVALLRRAGFAGARTVSDRGLDHGVFVPLKVMWDSPLEGVPVLQVSLLSSMDAAAHYRLGRALAELRDDGVLLVGSGAATHNLRAMGLSETPKWAKDFITWLTDVLTNPKLSAKEREERVAALRDAPGARESHPRAEHLLPAFIALGAAGGEAGALIEGTEKFLGAFSTASFMWK